MKPRAPVTTMPKAIRVRIFPLWFSMEIFWICTWEVRATGTGPALGVLRFFFAEGPFLFALPGLDTFGVLVAATCSAGASGRLGSRAGEVGGVMVVGVMVVGVGGRLSG